MSRSRTKSSTAAPATPRPAAASGRRTRPHHTPDHAEPAPAERLDAYPTELPVPHRLAILYLALPLMIWLVGWFEWWFGIPAAAAIAAGLWPVLSGSWRAARSWTSWPVMLALLAVALGWTMITAAGGVFDSDNGDWERHRAIITALSRHPWPVHLPDFAAEAGAAAPMLRYYLGFHVVPGLVARWFGIAALNLVVPLWTWCGVALLTLAFAPSAASKTSAVIAAAVILVFFSGMDVARFLLFQGWDALGLGVTHIEWELRPEYHEKWRVFAQFSSNTTALMWAPQHFIAAGLAAMLLLESRRWTRLRPAIGIVVAASLFWSPFVAVGLLPLVAALSFGTGIRPFLRWQNLSVTPLLAALLAGYLLGGSSDIKQGWLWQRHGWEVVAQWLPVFYVVEFLALVVGVLILQPGIRREWFFVASVAALLVLPLYWIGYHNNAAMRFSLPALVVLCWYTARALARRPRPAGTGLVPAAVVAVILILGIGAVTPLVEMDRAVHDVQPRRPTWQDGVPHDRIYYDSLSIHTTIDAAEFITYDIPPVLDAVLKDHD